MKYSKINGKKATKKLIAEAERKFPWLKKTDSGKAEPGKTDSGKADICGLISGRSLSE